MTTIRCLRNVLHVGDLYLKKGETAEVGGELAAALIKGKHVEKVADKVADKKAK